MFIDPTVHSQFMTSSVQDLLNIRPNVKVIHVVDWSTYNTVIFNNLDANPKMTDQDFATVMHNMFEKLSEKGLKVKENASIVFGQNLRCTCVSQ